MKTDHNFKTIQSKTLYQAEIEKCDSCGLEYQNSQCCRIRDVTGYYWNGKKVERMSCAEFQMKKVWDDTPRKRLSVEEIQNCKVIRAYIEVKLETLIDMEKKYYDTLEGLQRYIGDNNLNNKFTNFTYYADKHSDLVQFPIESIDFLLNRNTHEYKTEDHREKCSNCGANTNEMQEFNCTDFSIKTVLE